MRKIIFLILFCMALVTCWAGKRHNYVPIYQIGDKGLSITDVVKSDTATIICMRCVQNPGDDFEITESPYYLCDENRVRYPLKYAEGVAMGQANVIPYSGVLEFSLVFEPLPKETRIFDLLPIYRANDPFAFWGIHKEGEKVWKVKRGYEKKSFSNEYVLSMGEAVIHGKIQDFRPESIEDTLAIYSVPLHISNQIIAKKRSAKIEPDGQFEFHLPIENTTWLYIDGRKLHIPVLVNPDDTLNITISGMGEYDMEVTYTSHHGYDVMPGLMKADPSFTYFELFQKRPEKIRPMELPKEMETYKSMHLRFCDYLTWKYNLTEIESHLLLLSLNSIVDGIAILRLNNNIHDTFFHAHGLPKSRVEELCFQPDIKQSYSFVSNINTKDYSYFVLPEQFLLIHLSKMDAVSLMWGLDNRLKALETHLGQKLDEEWIKRLCF